MRIIADLHIHSRHSRATSKDINIENLEKWAKIKGVSLLGTGDFQHPLWNKELKEKLREDKNGILWSKNNFPFIWQTEISLIYSNGRRRAVHFIVLSPNTETSDKIIFYLKEKGRVDYDGRPIFSIKAEQFVSDLKKINSLIEIIPAHCMTPWFGLFGSDSGFDSLVECFGSQKENIYAVESGMSASPDMLWRLKENVNIVSFSDSHSFWPWRLGREATIFEIGELSYNNLIKAIRTGEGLKETIETPPEYGKYHWDGHRACNFSCSPKETEKIGGLCPVCNRKLTIGVENRIEKLAKEKEGFIPKNARKFYKILPLHELIAFKFGVKIESKKTWQIYNEIIDFFKNEFNVLLEVTAEELELRIKEKELVRLILLNREGKLDVVPGFDGTYGKIVLSDVSLNKVSERKTERQTSLF